MSINPKTPGIHHVNLRCSNLTAAKTFYNDIIGFPIIVENDQLFAFTIGNTLIVFKQADANTEFNPLTIGTDHIALVCESEEELKRVANALSNAKIENTGVKLDATLQKQYVAFKDPDRIQWEFYMK